MGLTLTLTLVLTLRVGPEGVKRMGGVGGNLIGGPLGCQGKGASCLVPPPRRNEPEPLPPFPISPSGSPWGGGEIGNGGSGCLASKPQFGREVPSQGHLTVATQTDRGLYGACEDGVRVQSGEGHSAIPCRLVDHKGILTCFSEKWISSSVPP
jgi:hypothetical protein